MSNKFVAPNPEVSDDEDNMSENYQKAHEPGFGAFNPLGLSKEQLP